MRYLVEIEAPGRVTQQFPLPEAPVQLGSGKEAELQVEGATLAARHLSLQAQPAGVLVRALVSTGPSLAVDGAERGEALVPWGAEVFCGGIRLSFLSEESAKRGTSPWLLLALGVAVSVLGWQGAEASAATREDAAAAPALTPPATPCSESTPADARSAAISAEHVAHAKQERYPFDATEGVKALQSYRLAEACFVAAGDTEGAAQARRAQGAFENRVTSDYADLRLRLEIAMTEGQWPDVHGTVGKLKTMVQPLGTSSYSTWLDSVRRRADARLSVH